ncbi:MAG: VWA domain-containing protein [Haloferacaceae archaeon]
MRLTPETTEDDLRRFATPGRESEARRDELERLANLCVDRETDVRVRLDRSRALCRPAEGSADFEILVPTRSYEQVVTDLPAETWDRLVQVAFLFHELGHVLYSDFERFGERLESVDGRWRALFRTVFNATEDGVIETQVAAAYRVADDLRVLNETLSAIADERHGDYVALFELTGDGGDAVRTYTVYEAVRLGLLDTGFHDSGRFAELCDPDDGGRVVMNGRRDVLSAVRPELRSFADEMLTEPDPTARVDLAYDLFERLRPRFEDLPPLQRGRVQTSAVRPADARPFAAWSPERADRLPEATDGSAPGGTRGTVGTDERADERSRADGRVGVRRGTRRSRSSVGSGGRRNGPSPLERDARELLAVVRDESTSLAEIHVAEPAEGGGESDRWADAVRHSRRLEADLRTQLRRERRPREQQGARLGRLDSKRLVAAARGAERVFTRRSGGTEKDYTCLLVLDRSGSMDGAHVAAAETAVAQLATALYGVGVDVSVLSLWQRRVTLELPFGGDPDGYVDRLMTRRAAGSTPLSDAVEVARRRTALGSGAVPFVVVVTDGRPDDERRYRRELDRCSVPVFGVYVGDDDVSREDHSEYFDRIVDTGTESVAHTLRQLIRRLFSHQS